MKPHISVITLGVKDFQQARKFYSEGLGWPVLQDYPGWVLFKLGDGSCGLGLYPLDSLARDTGISTDGTCCRGIMLSYIVRAEDRVEAVLAEAKAAGGTIVKPMQRAQWGGADGYFADPEGYIWKVAAGGGDQPYAAE